LATARTKSLTIWLAKRPGRQGQEHLFPEHVFKRKAAVFIIPDFRLRRGNCVFRTDCIHSRRTEKKVIVAGEVMLNGFDATRAGHLEVPKKAALEANVGDDLLRSSAARSPICSASPPKSMARGGRATEN
jgi:hypothetical protein